MILADAVIFYMYVIRSIEVLPSRLKRYQAVWELFPGMEYIILELRFSVSNIFNAKKKEKKKKLFEITFES